MKRYRYGYVIAFVVVLAIFGIKYWCSIDRSMLTMAGEANAQTQSWNHVIAESVNAQGVTLNLDGRTILVKREDLYLDDERHLMIAADAVTDYLNCSVLAYHDGSLRLEKAANVLEVNRGSDEAMYDDEALTLLTPVKTEGERDYFALESLAECFQYTLTWDYTTNTANLINDRPDEKVFPLAYDYRETGRTSIIHNQADLGTCWAFASLTALETALLPEIPVTFSVDHMTYHSGFDISPMDGGEYMMSMAYLLAWNGPVYESDDPYGDGYSPSDLEPKYHVQEIQVIASKNLDEIKRAAFLYGGVQSSLYMSVTDADGNQSEFYNPENYAYCYMGTAKANHDIVIIGWDDSYPASNFATVPEGDGAFICVNSWGENFGDGGYFYVSYYDSNIGMHNVVYTGIENTDNYDHLYQSDICGWVGQLGYARETAYFANVYEVETDQTLEAVGFYATGTNTEYEVYVVSDFEDTESFESKVLLSTGTFANAGYYTVELPSPITIATGHKCAVVVSINTPGAVYPVAIEYCAEEATKDVIIDDGEGYISLRGSHWERVEDTYDCNICLKMYTKDIEEEK